MKVVQAALTLLQFVGSGQAVARDLGKADSLSRALMQCLFP